MAKNISSSNMPNRVKPFYVRLNAPFPIEIKSSRDFRRATFPSTKAHKGQKVRVLSGEVFMMDVAG